MHRSPRSPSCFAAGAATASLLALLAIALPTIAHGAPEVLDVEEQILQDEGDDLMLLYDGHDLYDLWYRPAYWAPLDAEGIIFRVNLYGGFGAASTASQLHVDLMLEGPHGEHTFRMTTTDDQNWTGDLHVIDLQITPQEPGGAATQLQLFASLEDLGAAHGDNLTNIRMASYADDTPVDAAPGGTYLPGVGATQVPRESEVLLERIMVGPAHGYTSTTVTGTTDGVLLEVDNQITAAGQHIRVVFDQPGMEALESELVASLDAGKDAAFQTTLRGLDAPATFHVVSDLGGRETFTITETSNGWTLYDGQTASEDGEDAPGLALWMPLLLVGLLAIARRQ